MTKLKIQAALSPICGLTITDISGFFDNSTNPNGFLPETNTDPVAVDTYKISNGYFFNVLLYNVYNQQPLVLNPTEAPYHSDGTQVSYADNFTPILYNLAKDGSYTVKRFFLISKEFYDANKTGSLFTGKEVFYIDGAVIYHVISGSPVPLTIAEFLSEDLTTMTGMQVSSSFISTCYVNTCYSKVMSLILANDPANCSVDITQLITIRDYLYMTLEVIKYLKEFNNITQIQKLLETTNLCGTVCTSVANVTSSNCGCNG